MTRLLVWGGGPYHSMAAQSDLFRSLLAPLGFELTYLEDRSAFNPENLSTADVLMIMGLDWSVMSSLKPETWEDPSKARPYEPLSEKHWQSLQDYLASGKPLFCHHSGLLSFDEKNELEEIYDGRWVEGQSFHPPYQEFSVEVADKSHPITRDLIDFKTRDELYSRLRNPQKFRVLLRSRFQGGDYPLAWVGNYGNSKVFCSTLGHDLKSYDSPQIRKLLTNAFQWLVQS